MSLVVWEKRKKKTETEKWDRAKHASLKSHFSSYPEKTKDRLSWEFHSSEKEKSDIGRLLTSVGNALDLSPLFLFSDLIFPDLGAHLKRRIFI